VFFVTWTIWIALTVGGLAVLAALGFLGVRLLQGWRTLKRFRRDLGKEMNGLADALERTSQATARASDRSRLDEARGRLRITLARVAILREALDEATGVFGRLTVFYPRK
jgi:hypothetical protein